MNAGDHLAARLVELGVDCVFGVGGANIEDLFAAVQRRRPHLRAVLCKHEHGAGTAADAYARVSGRLGVALATSGGGAMNLVASLAEARASRVPVLALVGDPPCAQQGRGAFQDTSAGGAVDALAVHAAVSVWCARAASAEVVPALVDQAIDAALRERGPAVLIVAKDHQSAPLPRRDHAPLAHVAPATPLDDGDVARAAALLRRGPAVIIAGHEVARRAPPAAEAARDALARLADRLGAEVAVTPDARDAFDNRAARFIGVAGAMGHTSVERALADAAVVVLVGTRLPVMTRAGLEEKLRALPSITLGSGPPFIAPVSGEAVHLGGDVAVALAALTAQLGQGHAPAARRAHALTHMQTPAPATVPLGLATVGAALDRRLDVGTVVLVDAGNTGAAMTHYVRCPRGGRWLVALGMGGMGWTYGGAIGAACASRRRCVAITGDGAFYMHGLEVHTALEQRLPITWVVLDNRAHGMCLVRERLLLGEHAGYNAFGESHLARGLGVMFPGLATFACASANELERALAEAFTHDGPALVVVALPEVEVPPFVAFREALGAGTTTVTRAPS